MEHRSLWADVDGYLGPDVIQLEDLAGLTVKTHDRWEDEDDLDEEDEEYWDEEGPEYDDDDEFDDDDSDWEDPDEERDD
jgi:hypothetical protein